MKQGSTTILSAALLFTALSAGAQTQIVTFSYTGSYQTFTVPPCVSQISVDVLGAAGANANDRLTTNSTGGRGGRATGVISVTSGQVLYIYAGGAGSQTGGNAFNGGGAGGNSTAGGSCFGGYAGGGGGASDIRSGGQALSNRIIVAGGGGGSGRDYCNGSCQPCGCGGNGGAGGGTSGNAGQAATNCGYNYPGSGVNGGAPGTQSGGGSGGPGDGGGSSGLNGILGVGGDGATGQYDVSGGGGGGGYYGGGGGGGASNGSGVGGGGGAGGSSYTGGVTGGVTTASVNAGAGIVTFSYNFNGAGVTASASNPQICEGQSTTLNASGVISYTWGSGSNQTSIQVSPLATTDYTVYGTNNLGCVSYYVITVTVFPLPQISTAVTPSLLCVGSAATVSATGAATYTWTGSGPGNSVTVSPTVTSVYTVSGTSADGCVNTATVQVDVNTLTIGIVPGSTAICLGSNLNLTAVGGVSYQWGNGTSFTSIQITPSTSTIITLSGVDANGCQQSTIASVTVNPKPAVVASTPHSTVCKGEAVSLTAGGALTYSWSNGSTNTVAVVTPTLVAPQHFTVTGTDQNGCANTATLSFNVSKCTGITETGNGVARVFPNPSSGLFNIEMVSGSGAERIVVYSVTGAVVREENINSDAIEIDLRRLPNGEYFAHVMKGSASLQVIRLLKE